MSALTDQDGTMLCGWCETPYEYAENMLNGEWLWVRRCKAACKRNHREQKPKFVAMPKASTPQKGGA